MLGVALLERCGTGFDALDVAKIWLDYMPPGRIFTAERVAVRNLLEAYLPPETATRRNPFREWIGARLRVDAYGWAAPGDPVAAARMAWEDARVSHTANGVYAAMFMAAAHAASVAGVVAGRLRRRRPLGRAGRRAGSPRRCATARELAGARDWEDVVDELYARYDATTGCTRSTTRRSSPRRSTRSTTTSPARSRPSSRAAGTRTRTAPPSARSSARPSATAGIDERWSAPLGGRLHELAARLRRDHARRARPADARRRRRARSSVSIPLEQPRDPLVPRPIDLPTRGPARAGRRPRAARHGEDLRRARTIPADWPAWREALTRWRAEAAARIGYDDAAYDAPEYAWTRGCHVGRARLALGRAALRPRGRPLHAGAVLRRVGARVRRLRRDRALARVPGDRDRRAQPVRLLPRRARDPRARRRAPGAGPARLRRLQPVGRRHAARAGRRRRRDRGARRASSAPTASSSTR